MTVSHLFDSSDTKIGRRDVLTIGVIFGVLVWSTCRGNGAERLPDFAQYQNPVQRKAAFFEYLEPHIATVNARILAQRKHLFEIRDKLLDEDDGLDRSDRRWLQSALVDYQFQDAEPRNLNRRSLEELSRRMDIIAPSLVMAQAAHESGWGTSRFARLGNNLFGMRTYTPGRGIVPQRRPPGATWEVAAYPTVEHSIAAYIHNLNTNDHYRRLRDIRAQQRQDHRPVTGLALASGLRRYSARGDEYVSLIHDLIRSNQLAQYDQ